MNEYMAYCSLVCFENIDPIKNLEYDDKFCCRLKAEQVKESKDEEQKQ